jgi:hypothetical protein
MKSLATALVLLATGLPPGQARACIVRQARLEEAVERASALVIARVESIRETSGPTRYFGKTVQVTLVVEEVLGGDAKARNIEVRYSRPRAHKRGARMVCPLILGSGLEYELAKGGRHLFLLDGDRIVRAEPLAQKPQAQAAWKKKAARARVLVRKHEHLVKHVGKTITLVAKEADTAGQYFALPPDTHPEVTHVVVDRTRMPVYSKEPLPGEMKSCLLWITGTLEESIGPVKQGGRSGRIYEPLTSFHLTVDRWECAPANGEP